MDKSLLLPFLTYALVTTFTPGPNNITSTSAGTLLGYRRSLPYLAGIASGFFLLMLFCGLFTDLILDYSEKAGPLLKWAGVTYMLWLAAMPFIRIKKKTVKSGKRGYGYYNGILLQLVNIKVLLYGITMYVTFPGLIAGSRFAVAVSALFLASLSFTSISLWNLSGTVLSRKFNNRKFYIGFNSLMALLLIYVCLEILLN